jgi:hypothetical protein
MRSKSLPYDLACAVTGFAQSPSGPANWGSIAHSNTPGTIWPCP